MLKKTFLAMAIATAAVALFFAAFNLTGAAGAPDTALTGQVSSPAEGLMEGVLVSAKREGSTVTTTVVSDAKGRYSFPSARLDPGHYMLRIRAAGYEL
jgi:hypothetical protein